MHANTDDLDSVTNDLRDSAKGSNDGYDATFSLTVMEMAIRESSVQVRLGKSSKSGMLIRTP